MQALDIPALLRRHELHAKKSLGQNFLVSENALATVAAAANLTPDDTALEIGPGLGSLTRHLALAARRVVAIELDDTLIPALTQVLQPYSNVEIIQGDILKSQISNFKFQDGYKVVANIPYYITSAVIRHLLEAPVKPTVIVLTIQREVAERICATAGEMSLLAVSVQFYSHPRIVARIPGGAFYPRPNVDSAVLALEVLPQPAITVEAVDIFFDVVKAGFSQKRKQLRNSLSGGLRLSPAQANELLARAHLDPTRRAETLTLAEWGALAGCWQNTAERLKSGE